MMKTTMKFLKIIGLSFMIALACTYYVAKFPVGEVEVVYQAF